MNRLEYEESLEAKLYARDNRMRVAERERRRYLLNDIPLEPTGEPYSAGRIAVNVAAAILMAVILGLLWVATGGF